MRTITIDGVEYGLVPIGEEKTPQRASDEVTGIKKEVKEDILEDYLPEKPKTTGIKKAVPRISEYRERFKIRNLSPLELIAPRKLLRSLPKQDGNLDRFQYKGESLFFGEGIQQEV